MHVHICPSRTREVDGGERGHQRPGLVRRLLGGHRARCGSGRRPRSTRTARSSASRATPSMASHCFCGVDADEVEPPALGNEESEAHGATLRTFPPARWARGATADAYRRAVQSPSPTRPCARYPRPVRITVIGCGYLGAVHAACMADFGHDVIGRRRRRGQGQGPVRGPGAVLRAGAARAARAGRWPRGRLRFTTDVTDVARGPAPAARRRADGPLRLRRDAAAQGRVRRRHLLRRRGGRAPCCRTCAPATSWSASRPSRSAPRPAWRDPSPTPHRARCSPGTPSSSARATPSRTPSARTGWSTACPPTRRAAAAAQGPARRRLRRPARARACPLITADYADVRAGEDRRQRLPRDEDLVHQRDGRGLRGRRRRRHAARRRDRPRRADRAASSSAPASASAAAACPRTSARSWPAPASSAPTRR